MPILEDFKEENLEDLKELNLPPDVLENIRQARIEARNIRDRLDLPHITSWGVLIQILEDSLMLAKKHREHLKWLLKERKTIKEGG